MRVPRPDILEEIADECDLTFLHLEYSDALIPIGLPSPVDPTIPPMHCSRTFLGYRSLNLEDKLRVLSKQDGKEPYDSFFSHKRLGLGEIEFGAFSEEIAEPIQVPCIDQIEKEAQGVFNIHQ